MDAYCVIKFLDDDSTNITPESWIHDGMVMWPSYQKDKTVNKAIQHKEEPSDDWKSYAVRVLTKTGEN